VLPTDPDYLRVSGYQQLAPQEALVRGQNKTSFNGQTRLWLSLIAELLPK